MSHAMRGLEERVGVRLLSRTTRSVAPTDCAMQDCRLLFNGVDREWVVRESSQFWPPRFSITLQARPP